MVGVKLQSKLLSPVKFLDFRSRPAETPVLVPWNPLNAKAVGAEDGVEAAILCVGLPADPEAQVIWKVGLGKAVADGGEEFRVAVGGDLDENHEEEQDGGMMRGGEVFMKVVLTHCSLKRCLTDSSSHGGSPRRHPFGPAFKLTGTLFLHARTNVNSELFRTLNSMRIFRAPA